MWFLPHIDTDIQNIKTLEFFRFGFTLKAIGLNEILVALKLFNSSLLINYNFTITNTIIAIFLVNNLQ